MTDSRHVLPSQFERTYLAIPVPDCAVPTASSGIAKDFYTRSIWQGPRRAPQYSKFQRPKSCSPISLLTN